MPFNVYNLKLTVQLGKAYETWDVDKNLSGAEEADVIAATQTLQAVLDHDWDGSANELGRMVALLLENLCAKIEDKE